MPTKEFQHAHHLCVRLLRAISDNKKKVIESDAVLEIVDYMKANKEKMTIKERAEITKLMVQLGWKLL